MQSRSIPSLVLALWATLSCTVTGDGPGAPGGFGSGGPTCDAYTGGDAVACPSPGLGDCPNDVQDCCRARQPGVAGDAPDCPGAYPNNWTCVNQNCVHLGCTGDADCVMDGFTCKMVRGTHQCVHLCTTDTDCLTTARMPGTKCLDEIDGGGKICIEDL